MRCNPIRWLFGIMPILLLAGVAMLGERERIEKDLTARALMALEQAGLAGVTTTFEGRDARLTGIAFDEGEPARAARAVAGTHGVRVVHNDTRLIDKVDRYDWVAGRRENRVRLAGRVPNEKTRREIIGLARAMFPSYEISDRMELARGAPSLDTWLGGVGFGLKQLALLKSGQVRLDTTELTVIGEAIDAAGYRAVKTGLATGLPPGISLKADNVEAPIASPYVWTARLADGQLDIRGAVLNEKVRADLLTVARRAMPNAKQADGMQPARGAPDGWEAVARLLLRELARLEEGSVEIRDQNVTVAGMATKEATANDIRAKLREGIPAAYRMADRITFREPTIKTVSPHQISITFEDGGATLAGHVPSEEARAALLDLVRSRVPGNRIVDRLELGVGQIPRWQQCLDIGLTVVSRLGGVGRLALTDRQLVVTGVTESEALHKALPTETRAAANRDCDPDLQITLKLRPEPMLRWSATASSDEPILILEGEVPGIAVRDELLTIAKKQFPSRGMTDRMIVVGEPSERWKRTATVALTLLAKLRHGNAQIVDQVMSIKGEARDVVVEAEIKAAIGRILPEGYVGQEVIVLRSDAAIATEQASKLKAEEDLKRREAEAEAQRIAAAAAARQQLEAEAKQRAEAEAEQRASAAAARQQLEAEAKQRAEAEAKRRADAEVELNRQRVAAEMRRRHAEEEARRRDAEEAARAREADAARLRAEIEAKQRAEDDTRRRADEAELRRRVEETARLQRDLEARRAEQEREQERKQVEADVCGNALRTVAKDGIILFDWASDRLDRRSHPTLRRLAAAARSCPDVTIEIEGHTDSEGNDERNQPLSERRAQSVVDFLIKAGVPEERMKAVGYGSARPVVPNDTPENRARNRRIGFTVKVK